MKFYKLHGAGNDFIFFSGSKKFSKERIVQLCDRNFGIGADGVIIISKLQKKFHFKMEYFNSDGSSADFCANGGRCAVLLAQKMKYFEGDTCHFSAGDGEHSAEIITGGKVKLEMKKPEAYAKGLKFKDVKEEFYFLNTGVGHAVGYFKDISKENIVSAGSLIRYDERFIGGTNVDFIQKKNETTLKIRTYERGVEAETKACGTGIAAAGYLDMMISENFKARKIITVKGIEMIVSLESDRLFLTGPAELVFKGNI